MQERNRLARELYDSVTQSLRSATLRAEVWQRLLSSGDIERARGYLISCQAFLTSRPEI